MYHQILPSLAVLRTAQTAVDLAAAECAAENYRRLDVAEKRAAAFAEAFELDSPSWLEWEDGEPTRGTVAGEGAGPLVVVLNLAEHERTAVAALVARRAAIAEMSPGGEW